MQNTRGARELEVCIAEIIASVVVSVFASKPLLSFKKKRSDFHYVLRGRLRFLKKKIAFSLEKCVNAMLSYLEPLKREAIITEMLASEAAHDSPSSPRPLRPTNLSNARARTERVDGK